ncbi:MAG: hypothetical protein KGL13_07695 [Gammaproteobacteria bacterium]|nr:hypothetical protein [Gammaproteobacteria bacterium]MDE2346336.1 hypothetical protein [Gammaproteobacteria bacterium]
MRIAILSALLFAAPVLAAGFPPRAPELNALNVQSGHWIYHGTTTPRKAGARPGTFTWDEHCSWSADQLFLMCSFDNDWSGHKIQSLVVDTWNSKDRSYWHYEMYAVGESGEKPFASKMSIQGHTWIETGEDNDHGRKAYDRISYVYHSPTRVSVKIQVSPDQKHWKTTLDGTGVKQP